MKSVQLNAELIELFVKLEDTNIYICTESAARGSWIPEFNFATFWIQSLQAILAHFRARRDFWPFQIFFKFKLNALRAAACRRKDMKFPISWWKPEALARRVRRALGRLWIYLNLQPLNGILKINFKEKNANRSKITPKWSNGAVGVSACPQVTARGVGGTSCPADWRLLWKRLFLKWIKCN